MLQKIVRLQKLNSFAKTRGQSLAQMAISWLLKDNRITSVLIGVSRPEQLYDNVKALKETYFSIDEREEIEAILANK